MATADFIEDTGKQCIPTHISIIQERIESEKGYVSDSFKACIIEDVHIPNCDAIISYKKNNTSINSLIEFKSDSYPSTGNVVIELCSTLPLSHVEHIGSGKFKAGNIIHNFISSIVVGVQEGFINGSLGLGGMQNKHVNDMLCLSYLFSENGEPAKYYLLNAKKLNAVILENFRDYDLIITHSERDRRSWATISVLIPEAELVNKYNEVIKIRKSI